MKGSLHARQLPDKVNEEVEWMIQLQVQVGCDRIAQYRLDREPARG